MKYFILFFSLLASPYVFSGVLFQDPTGHDLNSEIKEFPKNRFENISNLKSEDKFFLGLFHINGAPEFNIKKDCSESVDLLKDAWENGIVDAGYTLSTMYYNGVCVKKDIDSSKRLATESADKGYILAERMLGRAYWGREWKNLYPKDMDKAVYWLSKAGEAGDRQSAANLAYIYREGIGIDKNEEKSFFWLEKAAFAKYTEEKGIGFTSLAEYYEKGFGTQKNLIKAYKFYDLSGSAGAEDKKRIAKDMTQEQIDEAIRESRAWQKENNVEIGGGFIQRAN